MNAILFRVLSVAALAAGVLAGGAAAKETRSGGVVHPSSSAITRHPSRELVTRHPSFAPRSSTVTTSRSRSRSIVSGRSYGRTTGRRSRRHHDRDYDGLRVGGHLVLRYNSDHVSLRLSTGGLSFGSRYTYVTGLGGSRCIHGNYYCTTCRRRVVGYPVEKGGRTFYYFTYDDGVHDDYYLIPSERVTGSILKSEVQARLPEPGKVSVTVPSAVAPFAEDFSSNLSPLFGGPGRVDAAFALGEERLLAGRYAEAAEALAKAAELAPGKAYPKMALALAYAGNAEPRRAIRMLRHGVLLLGGWDEVKVDPQDAFGSEAAYRKVLASLRGYAMRTPDDVDALVLLGYLHYLGDRYYHAAVYLERAERAGVADKTSLALLAEVHESLKDI